MSVACTFSAASLCKTQLDSFILRCSDHIYFREKKKKKKALYFSYFGSSMRWTISNHLWNTQADWFAQCYINCDRGKERITFFKTAFRYPNDEIQYFSLQPLPSHLPTSTKDKAVLAEYAFLPLHKKVPVSCSEK